jgi:hypothetical protein
MRVNGLISCLGQQTIRCISTVGFISIHRIEARRVVRSDGSRSCQIPGKCRIQHLRQETQVLDQENGMRIVQDVCAPMVSLVGKIRHVRSNGYIPAAEAELAEFVLQRLAVHS